jgi:hypothetical protein
MTKLTRKGFIAILESGKYSKITGKLTSGSQKTDDGKTKNCCAIGAILEETGMKGKAAAGYSYLPKQLVEDLDITKELEYKIYSTNDRTGDDNWAAVIAMLKKEWNITDTSEVNLYETMELMDAYYTEYYKTETVKEDFGYNF